jgi:regulator of PEP synthase PpsR (kinase-PPPase family)
MKYAAFFISDQTGITTESMGHALLSQFNQHPTYWETLPFIDHINKAEDISKHIINQSKINDCQKIIIFSSIVNEHIRKPFLNIPDTFFIDFFDQFVPNLEKILQIKAEPRVGQLHGMHNMVTYDARMEAINFTLEYDDGVKIKHMDQADVILIGVSRSGKTPTCLYLALHYGIKAANYPLLPEDLEHPSLPKVLMPYKHKLIALSIDSQRLFHIRQERRPNSKYAHLENCQYEVLAAEKMFENEGLNYLNTTHQSIEEVAALIKSLLTKKNKDVILP